MFNYKSIIQNFIVSVLMLIFVPLTASDFYSIQEQSINQGPVNYKPELILSAYYTKINSGEEFEQYSRTGPFADIIVEHGNKGKLVFARSSSYLPYWETSEGRFYFEELIERSGDGPEKRPDHINRYSHVRIIRDTPAQVVVHWRYVPNFDNPGPYGWVDEYFTITPDGLCVRTFRKGTKRLNDWNDPGNLAMHKIRLTNNGIKPIEKPEKPNPELILSSNSSVDFRIKNFDKERNNFVIECSRNGLSSELNFSLIPSADQSVTNPVFVLKNWGKNKFDIIVKDNKYKNYISGYHLSSEGYDLIVWFDIETENELPVKIIPADDIDKTVNRSPVVNAGEDISFLIKDKKEFYKISLKGIVEDDGLPKNNLSIKWEVEEAPGNVSFSDRNKPSTDLKLQERGLYELKLTADDGEYSSEDDIFISVTEENSSEIKPVLWFDFNEGKGELTVERVNNINIQVEGNTALWKPGIIGSALQFDGYTSSVNFPADQLPEIKDELTVETWAAIGAYPWNYAPLVNQSDWEKKGYYLGFNGDGSPFFSISLEGSWYRLHGLRRYDPYEWVHLAATYNSNSGMMIMYADGELLAQKKVSGRITHSYSDLMIGKNSEKFAATFTERNHFPSIYGFDGIIDEVKIYNRELTEDEIENNYELYDSDETPVSIQERVLPSDPNAAQLFGAYYTKLDYYDTWDNLWRLSGHPDIVVKFDQLPGSVVFWHGTTFSPGFVTENNIWLADQSIEEGGGGAVSLAEHMSDKEFRYSRVRLIENHDARVVVHWRYSNCDVRYNIPRTNQETGWGDWIDEYYYIYPDGAAVRKIKYWSETYGHYSWNDVHVFNQPGERPEENIDYSKGLFLANQKGDTAVVSYLEDSENPLPDANIELVNFNSVYKPYMIFEKAIRIHISGESWGYAQTHTWNHWPVAQIPSDGRESHDPYRVSHTTLSATDIDDLTRGDVAIYGFTDKPVSELIPLAKSWNNNPKLNVIRGNYTSIGYDRSERAYIVANENQQNPGILEFNIEASSGSPIYNPVFVIKDWGVREPVIQLNDKYINTGDLYRFGTVKRDDGKDLIIWFDFHAESNTKFIIEPCN